MTLSCNSSIAPKKPSFQKIHQRVQGKAQANYTARLWYGQAD